MKNDWMLDVLADLRCFADQNGLPVLSGELVRVSEVARREIRAEGTLNERVHGALYRPAVACKDV